MSSTDADTDAELQHPPWVNHFYAVISHASGAAILMLPTAEGWQLPHVRAEGIWLAETARIIPLLRADAGLDFAFTILRYVAFERNNAERWDRILFVIEPANPLHNAVLNGQWVDRAMLQALPFALPEQRAPLLHYLAETEQGRDSPLVDARRSPWARPGWFATASAWIEAAIVELGYTQTGPVEQLRNWSISSILVAPTSHGRVYFKAAAALPLFVDEPALTQTLAHLYPTHNPTPLKIDRAQGWMLMKDFGAPAWDDENVDLAPILAAYGKLQRASAHHLDALGAAGCIDRRLHVLASQIDPLIADPLTQSTLTAQEYAELVMLAPQLKARCARMADYDIPATLLHGDFHLGNITQRNGEYIFFDWTDAAVSYPFFDLFLLYFDFAEHADSVRWRDAYLDVWRDVESPARLLEAWEVAKPLCALHHAISYLTIVNHIEPLVRGELFHGLPDNLRKLLAAMRR